MFGKHAPDFCCFCQETAARTICLPVKSSSECPRNFKHTVSVDMTSFPVTAQLGVLNRTGSLPRISSLSPFPLFSKAAPALLGQIFGCTCFPSSGPRGEVSLLGHAQLAPCSSSKVCLCRLLMSLLSGGHSSAAQTGVHRQDSTETAQTQSPGASVRPRVQ